MGELSKIKRVSSIQEALFNIGTLTKEPEKHTNKKSSNSNPELFDKMFKAELERLKREDESRRS